MDVEDERLFYEFQFNLEEFKIIQSLCNIRTGMLRPPDFPRGDKVS